MIKYFRLFSNISLFFWLVLWLIIVLVLGTIAQKEIGLYQAQIKYFSSWYFWVGYLPLPSAKPVLALILMGLYSQLFFKTKFNNSKKIGITIAHLGALLLLTGGLITSFFSIEGSMIIPQGETINYLHDYHEIEFAIYDKNNPEQIEIFDMKNVNNNKVFKSRLFDIELQKINYFKNSSFIERKSIDNLNLIGFASKFTISEEKVSPEDSENQAALTLTFNNADKLDYYSIVQNMPILQTFKLNPSKTLILELRNKRIPLPFSLHLIKFEKEFYPSSMLPKSFKSNVYLIDGKLEQKSIIQMNEPLRYKGYTFYQSSFAQGKNGETTNLAVVKNYGRVFPYISSIIICIGLLLHLTINFAAMFKSYSSKELI